MRNILLVVLVFMSFSSCITNKSNTYLQEGRNIPVYPKAEYSYYKIQKNDEVVIRILSIREEAASIFNMTGDDAESYSYRVYDDGTIDIPFVNSIHIAGLTVREAAKVVEERLRGFIPDANVKLALANDLFYVIGESRSKGCFDLYKEKLNIFQAISLSNDFTPNGDKTRVRIIRPNPNEGRPIIKEFDLRSASVIDSEFYWVQPNDVIYVASIKSNFWSVASYSEGIGSLSSSIGFLLNVILLFNL